MNTLKLWWLASRPKTLTAAVAPVMVGSALAVYKHPLTFSLMVTLCSLLGALWIQIATNLFNDAIDFKKGADTTQRLGPQRVTQAGLVSSRSVMRAGFLSLFLSMLCGIPLVLKGGVPIVAIGLVSMLLAYLYTGGPLPLAYVGLGDLFVVLFFGIIAVGGTYYLQTGFYDLDALTAGVQIGFFAAVLICINNLRDRDQDLLARKKTIAVRFGPTFTKTEILFLIFSPFVMGLHWIYYGIPLATILPLLVLPLSVFLARNIMTFEKQGGPLYLNKTLAQAALLHILFGGLLSLGFVYS